MVKAQLAKLLAPDSQEQSQQTLLPDPYEPLRLLGRGGQGEAWLVRDESLDRLVVAKSFLVGPPKASDMAVHDQRMASVKAIANAAHAGVPTVFSILEHQQKTWLMTEFVAGLTLETLVSQVQDGLGLGAILSITQDLASALAALHDAGLVHGDINPANVIINPEGSARLIDFGLAQPRGSIALACGVPEFMAPELQAGVPVDSALDRFSLGCLLYWLLNAPMPHRLQEGDGRALLVYPDAPSLPSAPEEVLWGTARALTNIKPDLRPDLRVLSGSLAADARRLPAGSRDNLGRVVSAKLNTVATGEHGSLESQAVIISTEQGAGPIDVHESPPSAANERILALHRRENKSGARQPLSRRTQGVMLMAVVALVVTVAIGLRWTTALSDDDARPIYQANVSSFTVAPTTAMPVDFGEDWILRHVARVAKPHWRTGATPTVSLDFGLICHGRLCQLALAHAVEGKVHWHQQSLVASRSPGIWRGAIRDLVLAAARH